MLASIAFIAVTFIACKLVRVAGARRAALRARAAWPARAARPAHARTSLKLN